MTVVGSGAKTLAARGAEWPSKRQDVCLCWRPRLETGANRILKWQARSNTPVSANDFARRRRIFMAEPCV